MDSFDRLLFLDIIKHILLLRREEERPEEALGQTHSHANTGPPHFLRQLRLTVTWIGFYDAAHVKRGALPRDLSLGGCHQH